MRVQNFIEIERHLPTGVEATPIPLVTNAEKFSKSKTKFQNSKKNISN